MLFSVRLPRIVITLLAGMALALSGALLQGITRNELADPGIIGINSGAGVAVAIFFLCYSDRGGDIHLRPAICRIPWCFTDRCNYLICFPTAEMGACNRFVLY